MKKIALLSVIAACFALPAFAAECPKDGGKVELNNGMWAFGDKDWKAGTMVWVSKDGKDCADAPDGMHTSKDGKTMITTKGGKIDKVDHK